MRKRERGVERTKKCTGGPSIAKNSQPKKLSRFAYSEKAFQAMGQKFHQEFTECRFNGWRLGRSIDKRDEWR